MLFNSYIFVFLFLPLFLIGYFILNHFKKYTLAQAFLLIMSLWFYGYYNFKYLVLILISICFNYFITHLMQKNCKNNKLKLIIALLFNIGLLFYFKYFDFFIINVNRVFDTSFTLKNLVLPLGISFFTFQQISYVVDTYRGEVKKYNFLQYASFVVYFPQLIAGPIVSHDELIPQFMDIKKKKFNCDNFAKGLFMFILGLSKKVLIADVFANITNYGFSNISDLTTTNAILTVLSYSIQIYFDFSGYSDMAVGMSKMMNFDLPINFDSPYKSLTIIEFWQRWHKTLTRFFTKYIYIPLGGNRKGKIRCYINTMIVFVVSGFWHGANWTFILWGALHGIFVVITKHFKSFFEKLHPVFNWVITFSFVVLTATLLKVNSISDALKIFRVIFSFKIGPIDANLVSIFNFTDLKYLFQYNKLIHTLNNVSFITISSIIFVLMVILGCKNAHEYMEKFKPNVLNLIITIVLLIWCVLSFTGVSTFLYFNF